MIYREQCSVFVIFVLAIRLCFVRHTSDFVSAEIFYVEENIKMNTSNSLDKLSANNLTQCAVWCSNQHTCAGASYNIGLQECYAHSVIEFTLEDVTQESSGWTFLSIYKG